MSISQRRPVVRRRSWPLAGLGRGPNPEEVKPFRNEIQNVQAGQVLFIIVFSISEPTQVGRESQATN